MTEKMIIEAFEGIRKACAQLFNEALNSANKAADDGQALLARLLDGVAKKIEISKTVLSPEAIKIALSYREFFRETITFKELLAIVKQEFALHPGMTVCVLKTMAEKEFPTFDIVACSETKEVLFNSMCPWCHVVVANPDPELLKMFGEKSMLVLK